MVCPPATSEAGANKNKNRVKSKPLELYELAGKKRPKPPMHMLDIPFEAYYKTET
jgi:hypothetical protein